MMTYRGDQLQINGISKSVTRTNRRQAETSGQGVLGSEFLSGCEWRTG